MPRRKKGKDKTETISLPPEKETTLLEDEEPSDEDLKRLSKKAETKTVADKEQPEVVPEREEPVHSTDPTQLYLREIGFSPLLTAKQEVYYGRRVQKGDAAARKKMIESNSVFVTNKSSPTSCT